MKTKRAVLVCLGMLVAFAFSTQVARAGDIDCFTVPSSCGFGGSVASTSGSLTNLGADNATFAETVYKSLSGTYTYVFSVTNVGPAQLETAFTWTAGNGDNFNSGLNFGVIKGDSLSNVDDTGFSFNPLSLRVNFNLLSASKKFTFYAQGPTYTAGLIQVANQGSTFAGGALDPVSEPNVLKLLSSSLLFVLGILVVGRLRHYSSTVPAR